MMTTLRNKRRIQRTAKFNLEYLDDRIVPSTLGADVHVAAVSTAHVRAEERAMIVHERHAAKLGRIEARHEAKLARFPAKNSTVAVPLIAVPFNPNHPGRTFVTRQGGHGNPETSSIMIPGSSISARAAAPTAVTPTAVTPTTVTPTTVSLPTSVPTGSDSAVTTTSPLPPNVGVQLQSLYDQFVNSDSTGSGDNFNPTGVPGLVISGTSVGINVHTSDTANFNAVLAQLQSNGLLVSQASATYGIIDGMLPIGQLPAVAGISSGLSITPLFQPVLR